MIDQKFGVFLMYHLDGYLNKYLLKANFILLVLESVGFWHWHASNWHGHGWMDGCKIHMIPNYDFTDNNLST